MTSTLPDISSKSARSDFWRRYGRLLVTIAFQNVIVYGVNLLDNIMLGRYSELALSGVFIVNQLQFLLQMMLNGVADGTVVISSRHWGEKNIPGIKKTAACGLLIGLSLSGIMMIAALAAPVPLLSIFTDKAYVIEEATKYLRIVCFSYIFFAASQVMLGMLRSVESAFVGFIASCISLLVNLVLNYTLIFGKFGAPELGIEGAAIATLAARVVETGYIVVYLAFFDRKLKVKAAEMFRTSREAVGKFLRVSLPVVLSGTSWGIAMGMQTAILGRLTDPVISANSIASTVFQIISVFSYGSATAASVMIGKTIGEGKDAGADLLKKEVMHRAHVLQIVFLCIGSATGLALFLFKDFIIGFYNITPDTMTLAIQFMTVLSVTVIGSSYQMPCLTGIVRGGGDTKFVLFNDIIFMWGLVLPSSFAAAFIFELHPVFIFICLKADQILKCIVAVVKVNSGNWMKKI
ncbi:MAG: MATE family efflux transporter [Clostridia bacterium]|nr:MATE family efflux transporter [Clostridia bacterium]